MTDRIVFKYGEFYDFPRQITFEFRANWYLLRSEFDDEKDDYANFYDVYLLPFRSEEDFKSNPNFWMDGTGVHLGEIPITQLKLDKTRRGSFDARAFEEWLASLSERC
jgi:hypothetical protein